jgi:endo-1,4-beta-xylanase
VTAAGPLTLTATASDNVGVTRVDFSDGSSPLGGDTSSPFTFTVNLTSANNGNHSYTAIARDAAGNTATSAAVTVTVNISGAPPPPPSKFVGNITTAGMVRSDFIQFWDQITPENEGKWGSVEATRDVMNWAGLDAVHNYARDHGIPFKQHNFVWGNQQPNWIAGLSQSEQRAEVEEWIAAFCARYPDVALIDVVNEPPPHTTPVYMQALGGTGATGFDWIITAFQMARQHCPNAILILNDFNVLRFDTDRFIGIVNAVKGSGFIDALGEQAHGLETQSFSELQTNLNKVLATGLPLYITEYDVDLADDTQQRNVLQQQFTLFWNTPQIRGITLWGYIFGSTWKPNTGLIRNGTPRPAMTWLMGFLGR